MASCAGSSVERPCGDIKRHPTIASESDEPCVFSYLMFCADGHLVNIKLSFFKWHRAQGPLSRDPAGT